MCDYSLEMYASRPARKGERYTSTRFPSGSVGFATPGDCTTAVCFRHGSKLLLPEISSELQKRFGVGPVEKVEFVRLEHGAYRDGVKFANGKEASLQLLSAGVTAELVSEPVAPKEEPARETSGVLRELENSYAC